MCANVVNLLRTCKLLGQKKIFFFHLIDNNTCRTNPIAAKKEYVAIVFCNCNYCNASRFAMSGLHFVKNQKFLR